jgi:hypothetical protein
VVIVSPGGEESGSVGMRAWMRGPGRSLDRQSTLVVNLDAIGSGGHLIVSCREGLTGWFQRDDVDLSQRGHTGLRAVSILSYDDGWISNLHLPSDVPANVGWSTVGQAVALTEGMGSRPGWPLGDGIDGLIGRQPERLAAPPCPCWKET